MSMFADNPRDQEDWTVHVSSNRKDGDSKRPLYGESPETGSKSGGSEKKQLSGGANESREEETTDERGWFARCCSWIYRCLRGCVRIAGKRKGSTLTLSTVVGLVSLAQVVATIVLSVNIEKVDKVKCGDGDLDKHTPFWIIHADGELRCTWPTNNNIWRGLLSGFSLLLFIYVLVGLIRQKFGWFKLVRTLTLTKKVFNKYLFDRTWLPWLPGRILNSGCRLIDALLIRY
eukprot:gb/GECG01012878.1/.p1 GENE.gb/GECG01012878.1/~~gb/GECG01012878.1/.p1  ORF type:complete len:231 (+),score=10.07 gb/GECG01012878.1/:1-693(+)